MIAPTLAESNSAPVESGHSWAAAPIRLDIAVADRKLARSRSNAQLCIREGRVTVNGSVKLMPSLLVAGDDRISVVQSDRYVSRGGVKLEVALDEFAIDVSGKRCLDIGASTGGFTDCLVQHGAKSVTAIDVGHGQMDSAIAGRPEVIVLEGVNARYLAEGDLGPRFDIIVVDVSFISLTLLFDAITKQLAPDGDLICLVKPQFELDRADLNKHGVVRAATSQTWVRYNKIPDAAATYGLNVINSLPSPIAGGDGNIEYLAHLKLTMKAFDSP